MEIIFDVGAPFKTRHMPAAIALFLLCTVVSTAHAQNTCAAKGEIGGEKFSANHCAVALRTSDPPAQENSVSIWFNEDAISASEELDFQESGSVDDKKDGKSRTLVLVEFCPGGGASTASASAVKAIDLHTNHSKSGFLGIQTVVDASNFKVVKMAGEVKAGGTLAGKITATAGKSTVDLDFDVKLPLKDASSGVGCGH